MISIARLRVIDTEPSHRGAGFGRKTSRILPNFQKDILERLFRHALAGKNTQEIAKSFGAVR